MSSRSTLHILSYPASVRPAHLKSLLESFGSLLSFDVRDECISAQFVDDLQAIAAAEALQNRVLRTGRLTVALETRNRTQCRKCGELGHSSLSSTECLQRRTTSLRTKARVSCSSYL